MRVTIIVADGMVGIDGRFFGGIDMSSIDANIHAVQWRGESGEIEYVTNAEGAKPPNLNIDDLSAFQPQIDQWTTKRDESDAPPAPPSKEDRIAALQVAYDADRDKLNRAWLAAIIADGLEETARKASIKTQMDEQDAQLETDILTIIMEE